MISQLNEEMQIIIRQMCDDDVKKVIDLWESNADGLGLSDADTPDGIAAYLRYNDYMSFVAEIKSSFDDTPPQLVGTILAGTDMRRAYINHLFVLEEYRHLYIGTMLVEAVENYHNDILSDRYYIFVYKDNDVAQNFWESQGYVKDDSLMVMKKTPRTQYKTLSKISTEDV